jgi:hypothetical protein
MVWMYGKFSGRCLSTSFLGSMLPDPLTGGVGYGELANSNVSKLLGFSNA